MKKSIIKNISLGIACLLGVGGVVAAASIFNVDKPFEEARADGPAIQYISRSWDGTKIDEEEETCTGYNVLHLNPDENTLSTGWYVLNSDITLGLFNVPITINGNVNLILMDGRTLTVNSYIVVNSGNTLNIYSQSGGSGALNVTGEESQRPYGAAGIGGNNNGCGTINIYGGNVTATGGCDGAGIGGGSNGAGGQVKIYGGNVTATGGSDGAGIGGGFKGAGGEVIIYGGTVTATYKAQSAGIGGGRYGDGGTVNILGGTVTATATGGYGGAGIGGGNGGTGGIVNISGGTVTATGGDDGAGIGGGNGKDGGTVTISGGTVTASAGSSYASGIGKGQNGSDGTLTVNNDDLTVFGDTTTNPPTTIRKNTEYATTRWKYMVVKHVPHVHDDITFEKWESNNSLPTTAGSYYLKTDVVLSGGWTVPTGTFNLCLNDHSITLGDVITVQGEGCVLNIYDDGTTNHRFTGYLYKNSENKNYYGKVDPSNYDTFEGNKGEFTGGYIIRSNLDSIASGAALIKISNNAEFNLHSGALFGPGRALELSEGNVSVNISGGSILGSGNGIWNNGNSTISVSGGEFSGNGGHIVKQSGTSTLNLSGGRFTKNDFNGINATTINISGSPYVEDTNNRGGLVVPYNDGVIYLTAPLSQDAHIDIHPNFSTNTRLLTEGWSTYMNGKNPADYFSTSVVANTVVEMEGNEVAAKKTFTITYDKNDATSGVAPDPATYSYGTEATVAGNTGNLEKPNLVFGGWNTQADGKGTAYAAGSPLTVTADTTLYAQFVSHVHNWSYSASNNSIHATCSAANCPIDPNDPSLNLSIKEENFVFDNTAKTISFVDGYSTQAFDSGDIDIAYLQNNTPVTECINAGTYEARVTVEGATISGTFNITQATPTGYDIPTGLEATYGDNLSSVALPSTWSWKTPIDKVGDAGDRMHTAIYTPVDPNYKAVEETLTINVATVDPDPVGVLNATYGDTLADVTLPAGWAWDDATQSVGNVGSHDFAAHYTAVDTNHHDKDASITVSVSQAVPTGYDIPTDLKATYGDSLSSVELPDTWAWKNPNDKVGNAGSREHIAIYTPTDPNYRAVENVLTVSVAKANPTYTLPTDIEMYINETLSNVTLPSGFSWMDESIKASSLGENTFKVKYTPADQANYNVMENIDLKVNVKWEVVDPSSSSTSIVINGADEAYTTDISVKVEVKTDISVEQKHNEYASLATNNFVKSNEDIVEIYNVKLIRTTDGVEEEIQPSDIKPGTKIIISMAIPENLVGKEFRLLHIHNSDDITEVTNYAVSKDGKTLTIEVDRLSEFAFIGATDKDNGFIYNSTPIWALILLIIFSIILLVGIYCLYRLIKDRNDNSNSGDKSVKTMSITFISPVLLAYLGLNGIIIAFIIVAALSVIVWVTNLCLFIANKKRKHAKLDEAKEVKKEETKPLEEAKPVVKTKEPEPVNEEEEEETVTITDEKGNIFNIRYIKSFTAKLIQSPDETKKYYEELKNYVLSYKKTTSRVSWHYDSINSGRNQVLKFAIRGKTLCVYYPLNADDYNDTKYKVETVESKKFEEVPCLYRIKNDRRLGYAKDLIDTVMSNLGLEKGEEQHEVYSNLPYEPNAPLIARGLIKELKVQVNKPVEQVVSKKVNDEGDEIVTTRDAKGNIFEIRYIKSFTAKLSQASDEVKDYYNELKNYALSYKKANSRVSWHFDSINVGRNQVIKFSVRGKTLCVYYALNANDYIDIKYKVEVVESKKFEEVPCLYRIKNDRRRDYAKDLIDTVMANVPTEKGKESNEDFRIPYESTKTLLAKGLIKENKIQVSKQEEQVIESHEDEEGNEVVLSQDNAGNVYETRYVKSFRARLIEASEEAKEYYKELRDYILSYQDVDESISWLYDSINHNREQLFKLNIRGKTLCVYYALDTSKVGEKYKVENSDTKKYSKVPCLYRISNPRRVKLAKELIDRVMRKHKLILSEEYHDTYHLKNKSRDELIKKGLIKEVKILVK